MKYHKNYTKDYCKVRAMKCSSRKEFCKKYNSAFKAAKAMNKKHPNGIQDCCHGRQKTAYGFKWEFVNAA